MKSRVISSPDYFQEFDFFSKIDKSSVKSSSVGGVFTCIIFGVIFLLFIQEFVWFAQVEFVEYVSVDRSGNSVMDVAFDIAFPNVKCSDIMFSGQTQVGVAYEDIHLLRMGYNSSLSPGIVWCKECAQGAGCCRCEDVYDFAYRMGDLATSPPPACHYARGNEENLGCRFMTFVKAPKMKGILYFITQSNYVPIWDHEIFVLSFGKYFDGMINPLSGHTQKFTQQKEQNHLQRVTYSITLIPTVYDDLSSDPIESSQYSVSTHTELLKPGGQASGIFLQYDLSPMLISKLESEKSFFHLLTRLCAIIGGVWVISGLFYTIILKRFLTVTPKK